jgi:two-component system, cell cycle sensor histidine kinase and response regulator CckA
MKEITTNPERSNREPSRPILRLLIVEDNPIDAELEIETLKIAGYSLSCDVVDSAEELRQHLDQTHYDIIICDHDIGDWKGTEALEILQQSHKGIPVLIVTAALGEEAAVEYLKEGAADYVLKDRLQRLPSAVGRALKDKALREEAARLQEQILDAKREWELTFDSVPDAVIVLGETGRVQRANRAAVETLGLRKFTDLIGKPCSEIIHGQEPEPPECPHCLLRQTGTMARSEIEEPRLGKTFDASCTPLRDSRGAIRSNVLVLRDITEHKRAEEAARNSEARYRLFFEGNPLPGWLFDPESLRFLAVNQAAIMHYGYSRNEFLSMTIKDIQPPEDVAVLFKKISKVTPGIDHSGRRRHRKKDGVVIDVEITSYSLSGPRPAVFVLVHDITERLRGEAELREASERLDLALTASRTGVWTWYAAEDRIVWDAYIYQLFGIRPGSFGGTFADFVALVHPEDRDQLSAEFRKATEGAAEHATEFRVVWPDGSVHRVKGRGQAFYDEAGHLVRVTGVTHDITEAKQAEEALRKSEANLSLAQSIGHLGSWEQDLVTGDLVWSAETFRIFGVDQGNAHPNEQRFWERVHSEDRDLVKCSLAATVSGIKAYDCEHRIIRPDGSVRLIHGLAKRVLDSSGSPIRMVGTVQDITEHRSLEDQLRQSQKMEAIGTLAGGVAHDFNNLLGVITGYCDLLPTKCQLPEPVQKGLSQIRKAADRATSLTTQLLAFSRRQIIKPQILDLNSVIGGIEPMLRRLIGEDVDLKIVCHSDLWCVNVDAGQMEQVLMNLAVNARDAMPKGGQITIETTNLESHGGQVEHREVMPGSYVMIAVSDTGCGMDDDTRSHVFEPFFTTKEQGKGTGLGLSTVYGIIKQSDGYIWFYSEVGGGTTFKIYLPAFRDARPVVQAEAVSGPLVQRTGTVLVVEDQQLFRDMIQDVLDQSGYRVLVAQSGDEALRICAEQTNSIDLVLTDVVMPKMSGPQLAERTAALYPKMKVLFMSGYADDAIVRHGILPPQTEFLQKPFSADSLVQKVQAVLSPQPVARLD